MPWSRASSRAHDDLHSFAEYLTALEQRRAERCPALDQARRLAAALAELDAAHEPIGRLSSLESTRMLLAADDRVSPIVCDLTDLGRAAITQASNGYEAARAAAIRGLEGEATWMALDPDDRERLLADHRLLAAAATSLASTESVVQAIDGTPLARWSDRQDAVPSRAAQALEAAVRLSAPAAVSVGLPGRSISRVTELDGYLDTVRRSLSSALAEHGSIVVRGS